MIITIDGPAGAGKSTVARVLAKRLGFEFLDTGAMYRAVALAGLRAEIDWSDERAVERLAQTIEIRLLGDRVLLAGRDVTDEIRTVEVTRVVGRAADHPGVRAHLVQLQRAAADGRDIVCEGRDQGTIVFPDSPFKVFLFASADERARRRHVEMQRRGESSDFQEVLRQQNDRDLRDRRRPVGALTAAADAVQFSTDGLTLAEVVDRLEDMARERIAAGRKQGP